MRNDCKGRQFENISGTETAAQYGLWKISTILEVHQIHGSALRWARYTVGVTDLLTFNMIERPEKYYLPLGIGASETGKRSPLQIN